jgi:hypothetical protein
VKIVGSNFKPIITFGGTIDSPCEIEGLSENYPTLVITHYQLASQ